MNTATFSLPRHQLKIQLDFEFVLIVPIQHIMIIYTIPAFSLSFIFDCRYRMATVIRGMTNLNASQLSKATPRRRMKIGDIRY